MFTNTNGYSLADLAAVTNNNEGFGNGGNSWWIILFILILFGGWNGYNNGPFGGNATGSGITDGYILTSDFANIERKIDTVNGGLCDGFYAMNTGMLNGFAGVNNNITQNTIAEMQNTNALTAQITGLGNQVATCCCEGKQLISNSFADLNYRLAEQSCQTRQAVADASQAIIASQDENTRLILKYLTDDKIATLQAENQSLRSAASQAEQNAYLIEHLGSHAPVAAYVVQNPYATNNNGGYCPYANA